jgi:hypothetical protein
VRKKKQKKHKYKGKMYKKKFRSPSVFVCPLLSSSTIPHPHYLHQGAVRFKPVSVRFYLRHCKGVYAAA